MEKHFKQNLDTKTQPKVWESVWNIIVTILLKGKYVPLCQIKMKLEGKFRKPIARKIGHCITYFNLKTDSTERVFNAIWLVFCSYKYKFSTP